jgi:hypothetical protein
MMTDAELAERWAREDLLDAIYRVTWRTGEEMPVESARMIGQSAVIRKSMDPRVEWLTVDQWRGHTTGWVRLGTIVRNAAGEYERLLVGELQAQIGTLRLAVQKHGISLEDLTACRAELARRFPLEQRRAAVLALGKTDLLSFLKGFEGPLQIAARLRFSATDLAHYLLPGRHVDNRRGLARPGG